MFKNMTPLNQTKHRELRFEATRLYPFADQEMMVPLVASELALAQREYVVAFSQGENSLPHAVVGVEQGRNGYVLPNGVWTARYVPAHVRRYPFQAAALPPAEGQSEAEQRFSVMVDEDAPQLGAGDRLFTDEGTATPLLARVQEVLTNLQRDLERTRYLVQLLDEVNLLSVQTLSFKRKDGRTVKVEGLRVVDVKAFAALSGEALVKLQATGALAMVYAHLYSLENLKDGALTRAQAGPAVEAPGTAFGTDGNVSFN